MNKRIEELLGQALDLAVPETWTTLTPEQLAKVSEKFAELIVRECAKVCRTQPNEYAMELDRENCASAIEEHFGVEE